MGVFLYNHELICKRAGLDIRMFHFQISLREQCIACILPIVILSFMYSFHEI